MPLKIKLILLMVATLGAAIFVSYTIFERGEDELLQQVVQHVKSVENVGNVLEIQQLLTRTPNQTIERTLSVRMGPSKIAHSPEIIRPRAALTASSSR